MQRDKKIHPILRRKRKLMDTVPEEGQTLELLEKGFK